MVVLVEVVVVVVVVVLLVVFLVGGHVRRLTITNSFPFQNRKRESRCWLITVIVIYMSNISANNSNLFNAIGVGTFISTLITSIIGTWTSLIARCVAKEKRGRQEKKMSRKKLSPLK